MVNVISRASTADELWAALSKEPYAQATFVEDVLPKQLLASLVEIAGEGGPVAAAALSALGRASAFDPLPFLLPHRAANLDHSVKAPVKKALLQALAVASERWDRNDAEQAEALALAVARTRKPTDDLAAWLAELAIAGDVRPSLRAAAWLAIGATTSTLAKRAPRAFVEGPVGPWTWRESFRPSGEERIEALARVAAGALLGDSLGDAEATILVHALEQPFELPAAWGIRWQDGVETSQAIAVRVLSFAKLPRTPRLPVALRSYDGAGYLLKDAAYHVAFDDGARLNPLCPTFEELDETGLAGVALFATPRLATEWTAKSELGIHKEQDARSFVDRSPPFYRPVALEVEGVTRQWHFVRVGREVLHNGLDPAIAAGALAELGVQLFHAVTSSRRRMLLALSGTRSAPDAAERELALTLASFRALEERGLDVTALVDRADWASSDLDPAALAAAALEHHSRSGEPFDAARRAQIVRGISKARKRALLLAMIDDPSLRAGIEADLAELER
jgi:hypothetical protein